MANTNTYNGWTNRETWLVNLHFGDTFFPIIKEDFEDENSDLYEDKQTIEADMFSDTQNKKEYVGSVISDIAERYETFFEEMVYEDLNGLSSFISDYLDFSLIDWYDLARSIYSDLF